MNKETFEKARHLNSIITALENIEYEFKTTKEIKFAWEGLNTKYNHEWFRIPEKYNEMIYNLLMNELEKVKQEFKEL